MQFWELPETSPNTNRMVKVVEIRIAEMYAGDEHNVIVTNGVGSCIVIILYDKLHRIGGMAHAILPHVRSLRGEQFRRDDLGRRFVKCADEAVDVLVEEVEALGATREGMVAKLVGGAHMFSLLEGDKFGIGWENTESARERLREAGITIETEVVGGTVGRNVRFDCATGIVEITTKV